MILSTHIVDDVADLCPNMAILAGGRIVEHGAPSDLVAAIEGRIWRKEIERDALEDCRARHEVISTHLRGGRNVVHVYSESEPGEGFEAWPPNLEDVYFASLKSQSSQDTAVA